MIGKIIIGKSFRGCLNYCLHDKLMKSQDHEAILKDRAEVLCYNQCYGNDKELIQQFNEVRQLNPRLSKPVLHITLSLAPGEKLQAHVLTEIAQDCAKDLGFSNNQFVAVLHKDTGHQHLHIVGNRIGFDRKTLSDSNNYKKIAEFCRKMELKHELQQVLNPRRYLSKEFRNIPRLDQRKQQLKEDIKTCLVMAKDYPEFERKMKNLRYEIIKARGIAFRDPQKVYTKGSEVGYSLATVEKILALKPELRKELLKDIQTSPASGSGKHSSKEQKNEQHKEKNLEKSHSINIHLKPSHPYTEMVNPALLKEAKKRSKRKRRGLC
ncbi:relaxase/mobilization nuclease domain-containing protein [Terrimonas alba]|uniref:relaxase/mobilization nuclease domain-containing protein n=1 Tax=Terrimonas alba TaxID=3349636 RepID=UPI0035F3B224